MSASLALLDISIEIGLLDNKPYCLSVGWLHVKILLVKKQKDFWIERR